MGRFGKKSREDVSQNWRVKTKKGQRVYTAPTFIESMISRSVEETATSSACSQLLLFYSAFTASGGGGGGCVFRSTE